MILPLILFKDLEKKIRDFVLELKKRFPEVNIFLKSLVFWLTAPIP